MLCLLLSVGLASQPPSPSAGVASPERQKALLEQIHRRTSTPQAKAKISAEKARISAANKAALDRYIAEKPARDAAREAALERARKEFEMNTKLQAQAREEYLRVLPLLLENQRQQLERMSAFERNVALNRLASSNQAIANAIGMESVRQANARLGYDTPYFTTTGPTATPYGPYGAMAFPPMQPGQMTSPNPAAIYNDILPVPRFP
jgi:hypothetical protein